MVESLLEFHLSEMGVTMEAFYAALASNPHAHLVKTLLEQVCAHAPSCPRALARARATEVIPTTA